MAITTSLSDDLFHLHLCFLNLFGFGTASFEFPFFGLILRSLLKSLFLLKIKIILLFESLDSFFSYQLGRSFQSLRFAYFQEFV
jgi:hypothetical protein